MELANSGNAVSDSAPPVNMKKAGTLRPQGIQKGTLKLKTSKFLSGTDQFFPHEPGSRSDLHSANDE
jgi:hypothetical protein